MACNFVKTLEIIRQSSHSEIYLSILFSLIADVAARMGYGQVPSVDGQMPLSDEPSLGPGPQQRDINCNRSDTVHVYNNSRPRSDSALLQGLAGKELDDTVLVV